MMTKWYNFSFIIAMALLSSCNSGQNSSPGQTSPENSPGNPSAAPAKTSTILVFGNSLTAGYGLDPSSAFPALIQLKLDSLGLNYQVVNAGVSGETSAGGNGRIDWILNQPIDIFILELGANDGLRGIPPAETKKNLQSIIDKVRGKYPGVKIILAGMQVPPNMGQRFSEQFRNIFPDLARENELSLIPFLLEGVGGEIALNQADGVHPTAEGQRILAENVWKVLFPLIRGE